MPASARFASARFASALLAVSFLLASHPSLAQTLATLSVQNGATPKAPLVVRSVRRDAVDYERFTSAAGETLELLLADDSSLTLAAGTDVVVDRFAFDPATRRGALSLRVLSGAVRVTGGILNNSDPIDIAVRDTHLQLDNGMAVVQVDAAGSDATLLLGRTLTVAAPASAPVVLQRGGQHVHLDANGHAGPVEALVRPGAESLAKTFNPGLGTGARPLFVSGVATATSMTDATTAAAVSATDDSRDGDAGREADLILAPAQSLTPGASTACTGACGMGTTLALNSPIGTLAALGSDAYSSAANWFVSFSQSQNLSDAARNSARVNYSFSGASAAAPRNTTNLTFSSATAGTSASFTEFFTSPALPAKQTPKLQFILSSPAVDGQNNYEFGSQLLITDYSFNAGNTQATDPTLTEFNPGQVSFVTVGLGMGGNVYSAFAFSLPWSYSATGASLQDAMLTDIPASACVDFSTTPHCAIAATTASPSPYKLFATGFRQATLTLTQLTADGSFSVSAGNPALDGYLCGSSAGFTSACQNAALTAFSNTGVETDLAGCSATSCEHGGCTATDCSVNGVFTYVLPDYFLAFEASGQTTSVNGAPTGAAGKFLYATGAVSGLQGAALDTTNAARVAQLNNAGSVDTFSVTPGLAGVDGATRAFLPADADLAASNRLGIALNDNGLVIINPPQSAGAVASRALQSDFALATPTAGCAAAGGSVQCSGISVTLGKLSYSGTGAQLVAYTIGSTQVQSGASSLHFDSPLESTAIGGGNPVLGGSDPSTTSGRVGYLVLQNFDDCTVPTACSNDLANGGTLSTVPATGVPTMQSYALLRVATATGTGSYTPAASAPGIGSGYLNGLVQSNANGALAALGSATLDLAPNTATATLSGGATLALSDGSSATLALGTTPGGTDYGSAYLSASQFAAFGTTGAAQPMSALVSAGQLGTLASGATWSGQALPATPAYLQWGFFFGDLTSTAAGGASESWHAQLVPWISGTAMDPNTPASALPSGSVSYNGIAVADVSYNSQQYVATGTYANTWNMASRKGYGNITLDGAIYPIRTSLTDGSQVQFGGAVLAPVTGNPDTVPSNSAAVGSLNGSFAAGNGTTCTSYCATMGGFTVVDATKTAHPLGTYTAVGVFGGSRH